MVELQKAGREWRGVRRERKRELFLHSSLLRARRAH